jgi:hypothetical protein
MSDSLLDEVKYCVEKIGCNDSMSTIMTTAWLSLEHFIAQSTALPARLQDLDAVLLARFVEARSKGCADVELLLLELTGIRMILLQSGFPTNQLTALSVRVKRERLANDKDGKYRFAKKLCA